MPGHGVAPHGMNSFSDLKVELGERVEIGQVFPGVIVTLVFLPTPGQ